MKKQIKTRCNNCRKVIYRHLNQFKKYKHHYCSLKCLGKFRKKTNKIKCDNCGNSILRTINEVNRRKRRGAKHSFCSYKCANIFIGKNYRSGSKHPLYKKGVWSYRDTALQHYGKKCANKNCQIPNVSGVLLDVHHIDGNRKNNKLDNLIVLCVLCHAMVTRKLMKVKRRNLVKYNP